MPNLDVAGIRTTSTTYLPNILSSAYGGISEYTDYWDSIGGPTYGSSALRILRYGSDPNYAEVAFLILEDVDDLHDNNWDGENKVTGLYIAYKPLSSDVFDTTSNPSASDFISDANSFKFTLLHEHTYDIFSETSLILFLGRDENIVLTIVDESEDEIKGVISAGYDSITPYNTGDTHGSFQLTWLGENMVPGEDSPAVYQMERTDGVKFSRTSTTGNCLACRSEFMTVSCNPCSPWFREKLILWSDEVNAVNTDPESGNSIKGVINPVLLSRINAHSLLPFQQVESGNYLHIKDGLLVFFDEGHGNISYSDIHGGVEE